MTAFTVSVPFQGLVPFGAARRAGLGDPHLSHLESKWQNSERGDPHLSLAPSGPSPNELGRSIRHASAPTSAFPARELHRLNVYEI